MYYNVKTLMDKHQLCIDILEAIGHFQRRRETRLKDAKDYAYLYPTLSKKYADNVEIIDMCIVRLQQRHTRVLNQIITKTKSDEQNKEQERV